MVLCNEKKKQSVKLTHINLRGSSREFTPGQTSVADSQILCKPMDFEDFRFTFFPLAFLKIKVNFGANNTTLTKDM